MIKILDVCSGIGGFSLGLEATGGFDTVAFCEYDEFCRKVLNKHWPDVPIYKDLKEIGNEPTRLIQEFDLICGGIPCQPFSVAGKQKGKEDDRHLWPYMYEIIKHKKPTWVIVENVGGFVNVALDDGCLDLETEGYATQSFIIPACGVEAPHRRDRIWIIGKNVGNTTVNGRTKDKPSEEEGRVIGQSEEGRVLESEGASDGTSEHVANSKRLGLKEGSTQSEEFKGEKTSNQSNNSNKRRRERGSAQDVADSESSDRDDDEVIKEHGETKTQEVFGNRSSVSRTQERYTQHREGISESGLGGMVDGVSSRLDRHLGFRVEPDIPRVAENIPDRVNRLKALGNSIVPQIIYHIGMAILEEEKKNEENK